MRQLFEYPVFEADQVLTADNLNDSIKYLTEQDLITRRKLLGIGIACGLEVTGDGSSFVEISKGVGLTSLGYLVHLSEDCLLEYYRVYEDRATPPYPDFMKNGSVQYDLWELHTSKEYATYPEMDMTKLADAPFDLSEMAVLLYLEVYDKDLKSCIGEDCEEHGIEKIHTLRKLLIRKDDLKLIIKHKLEKPELTESELKALLLRNCNLPEVSVERFNFNLADTTSLNLHEVNKLQHLKSAYGQIIQNAGVRIGSALKQTVKAFSDELLPEYGGTNPFDKMDESDPGTNPLLKKIFDQLNDEPIRFQYGYDLLRDLKYAYEEFLSIATEYYAECCPNEDEFPLHLMLNKALPDEEMTIYRHYFRPSPILSGQNRLLAKLRAAHLRIRQMIDEFKVEEKTKLEEIKITPGRTYEFPLSRQTPGFYYQFSDQFVKGWNFDKQLNCLNKSILSYHGEKYSDLPHVKAPLLFNIDQYGFFRIEGHIGQTYSSVYDSLEDKITRFNLPIDLMGVKLSEDYQDVSIDKDCFEDINVVYKADRAEFLSCLEGLENLLNMVIKARKTVEGLGYVDMRKKQTGQSNILAVSSGEDLFVFVEVFANEVKNLKLSLAECITEFDARTFLRSYLLVYAFSMIFKLLIEVVLHIGVSPFSQGLMKILGILLVFLKPFFGRLVDDCTDKKFLSLYKSYLERLRKHQVGKLFPALGQNKPGFEHLGGVYSGGTFILVYDDKPVPEQGVPPIDIPEDRPEDDCFKPEQVKEMMKQAVYLTRKADDISLEELMKIINPGSETPKEEETGEKPSSEYEHVVRERMEYSETNQPKENIRAQKIDANQAFKEYDGGKDYLGQWADEVLEEMGIEIPKKSAEGDYRVVADFALPYRCCDECNKSEVEEDLSIDLKDKFCKKDPAKYPVGLQPAGGILIGEGIENEGGVYYFVPSKVTTVGEVTLTYIYHDQEMTRKVMVYDPIADFEVQEIATRDLKGYKLINKSKNASDFVWAIKLESTDKFREIGGDKDLEIYEKDINTKTFQIKLTAYKGGCKDEKIDRLTFEEDVIVDISLPKKDYCKDDDQSYTFDLQPAGGKLEPMDGVVEKNGEYSFVPKSASSKDIIFKYTYDGQTATFDVELHEPPVAKFTKKNETSTGVTLVNSSQFHTKVNWNISNATTGQSKVYGDVNEVKLLYRDFDADTLKVKLTAMNDHCPPVEYIEDIVVPREVVFDLEQSGRKEPYSYCNNDTGGYKFTTDPKDGALEGDNAGVTQDVNGNYQFAPNGVVPGTYTYKYKGKSITVEVYDATAPDLKYAFLEQEVGAPLWIMRFDHPQGADKVIWEVNGKTFETTPESNQFITDVDFSNGPVEVTVTIYLSNGCEVQDKLIIPRPQQDPNPDFTIKDGETPLGYSRDGLLTSPEVRVYNENNVNALFEYNALQTNFQNDPSAVTELKSGAALKQEATNYDRWITEIGDLVVKTTDKQARSYLFRSEMMVISGFLAMIEMQTKDITATGGATQVFKKIADQKAAFEEAGIAVGDSAQWKSMMTYYQSAFKSKPNALSELQKL